MPGASARRAMRLSPETQSGPMIYAPAPFQGLSIAAGATFTYVYYWPKPVFIVGVTMVTRSGLASDLALLEFGFTDETQDQFSSDGSGQPGSNAAPSLALVGLADPSTPYPMQRPVIGGDRWVLSMFNRGGATIVLGGLYFYLEDAHGG